MSNSYREIKEIFDWNVPDVILKFHSPSEKKIKPIIKEKDEIINSIFGDKRSEYAKSEILAQLQGEWLSIAGGLGNHSVPEKIKDNKLYVRVEKAVYAQELTMYIPLLLKTINLISEAMIERIIIRVGAINWNQASNVKNPKKRVDFASFQKTGIKTDKRNNNKGEKKRDKIENLSKGGRLLIHGLRKFSS